MGLPARPKCVVRMPGTIFVGEPVKMNVELTAEKETKVDFIDVRVRGRQGWSSGSGESYSSYVVDLPFLAKHVMEQGVLPAGKHDFPLSFTLPLGTAPSHELAPAMARLTIDVHVSIPWWPDGKYSFVAPVRRPPPPDVKRTPLVSRQPFEAKPGQPRVELSLASSTLVAGEALVGSCALFHMSDQSDRNVEVSFEPRVRMLGRRRPFDATGPGYRSSFVLPAGTAGKPVPFKIGLPVDMTPTFTTASHDIAWFMKISVGSLLGGGKLSLTVPLTIVDARAARTLPALTLAPRVADQRVVAAFERFAPANRMRVVNEEQDAFPDEQPALVRDHDSSSIRIGYTYRGERGTFLVARAVYPPLGLGLSVTPSSGLRDLFTRDIEVGGPHAAWDRAHHVEAREAAQALAFLRASIPSPAIGTLVRWTDDEIVAERSIGNVEDVDLASIALGLDSTLNAIIAARASISPPSGVEVDLDDWRDLAARLTGQLVVGDLSIRNGTLDVQPIEIGATFDEEGKALAMRVEVGTRSVDDGREASERARELLASMAKDVPDAALIDGVATASLPFPAGADATRVRELGRALRAVIAALYETGGPYR